MMKVNTGVQAAASLLGALAIMAVGACGGSGSTPEDGNGNADAGVEVDGAIPACHPGTSATCACASGATGVQVCNGNGTFGPCECQAAGTDGGPSPDSRPAPDAATTPPDAGPPPCTPQTSAIAPKVNHATRPVIGHDGTVYVLYEPPSYGVILATLPPGGTWHLESVPATLTTSDESLAIDDQDGLHAAFFEPGQGLTYGYRPAGGAWQIGVLDVNGDQPTATIALTPYPDLVEFSYHYATASGVTIQLATCSTTQMICFAEDIADSFSLGIPSLVVGASGSSYVGYTIYDSEGNGTAVIAQTSGGTPTKQAMHDLGVDGEPHLAVVPGTDDVFISFGDLTDNYVYFGEYPTPASLFASGALVFQGVADTRGRVWWSVADNGGGPSNYYYRRETDGSITPLTNLPFGEFTLDAGGGLHVISYFDSKNLAYTLVCGQ